MAKKKRPAVVKESDPPAYGAKSAPPRKAVKDMSAKQEEPSSKDELHASKPQPKAKSKPTK